MWCRAVYLQTQLSISEERAEIHYTRTCTTDARTYILYQANLAAFAIIALEENLFLSSCLEFSSAQNDLSKVREHKSKSLKGLAQTLHLCVGHSEVKRIRLPQ